MLDLSPEKMMALMVIGLVVLGPQRLPQAARALARGLARVRSLADALTQPVRETLEEPRRSVEAALAEVRGAVEVPPRALGATTECQVGAVPGEAGGARVAKILDDFWPHELDPADN